MNTHFIVSYLYLNTENTLMERKMQICVHNGDIISFDIFIFIRFVIQLQHFWIDLHIAL